MYRELKPGMTRMGFVQFASPDAVFLTEGGTRKVRSHLCWSRMILESFRTDDTNVTEAALSSPLADITATVQGAHFGGAYSIGRFGFFTEEQFRFQGDKLTDEMMSKHTAEVSSKEWATITGYQLERAQVARSRFLAVTRGDNFCMLALRCGAFRVAKLLYERGVDVLHVNAEDETVVVLLEKQYSLLVDELKRLGGERYSERVKTVVEQTRLDEQLDALELLAHRLIDVIEVILNAIKARLDDMEALQKKHRVHQLRNTTMPQAEQEELNRRQLAEYTYSQAYDVLDAMHTRLKSLAVGKAAFVDDDGSVDSSSMSSLNERHDPDAPLQLQYGKGEEVGEFMAGSGSARYRRHADGDQSPASYLSEDGTALTGTRTVSTDLASVEYGAGGGLGGGLANRQLPAYTKDQATARAEVDRKAIAERQAYDATVGDAVDAAIAHVEAGVASPDAALASARRGSTPGSVHSFQSRGEGRADQVKLPDSAAYGTPPGSRTERLRAQRRQSSLRLANLGGRVDDGAAPPTALTGTPQSFHGSPGLGTGSPGLGTGSPGDPTSALSLPTSFLRLQNMPIREATNEDDDARSTGSSEYALEEKAQIEFLGKRSAPPRILQRTKSKLQEKDDHTKHLAIEAARRGSLIRQESRSEVHVASPYGDDTEFHVLK